MRVIMFCFAGREPNMELQLPLIRRILAEHPDVGYHCWNLACTPEDDAYLRTITGERITVINDLYGPDPWTRFDDIYRHYTQPEFENCLFVKLDDDVVFIETDRFGDFLAAIDQSRDSIVSAKVINNGACTPTEPGLWRTFEAMNCPLMDVHLHADYAQMAHDYLFDHQAELIAQPVKLIPTTDWLSINLIGYDYRMGTRIARYLGGPSPSYIAGRPVHNHGRRGGRLGDEGRINLLPRIIAQGFLAAHLTFGPQKLTDAELVGLRRRYAELGQRYLEVTTAADGAAA